MTCGRNECNDVVYNIQLIDDTIGSIGSSFCGFWIGSVFFFFQQIVYTLSVNGCHCVISTKIQQTGINQDMSYRYLHSIDVVDGITKL